MRNIEALGGMEREFGVEDSGLFPRTSGPFLSLCSGLFVALSLAAGVLAPPSLAAQDARARVEEGNRLYEEGRFEEAHEKYLEALLSDPESPVIRFNDGNALYRSQDYQRAMERFAEALGSEDPAIRSSAWYNLGNALYRQQQLRESLDAFKQALMADPSDADAKHNLERVLEQLQQQEQQQSGEDQRDQKKNQPDQDQTAQDQGRPPGQEGGEDRQRPEPPPQQEAGDSGQQGPRPLPPEGEEEMPGQPQDQPGEMTPDEAQRLLEAIREDPGEVNRRRIPSTGKRPRKDW